MKDQSVLQRLPAGLPVRARGRSGGDWRAIDPGLADQIPRCARGARAVLQRPANTNRRWPNRTWAVINKIFDPGSVPRDGDRSDRPPVFTCADPRPRGWNTDAGAWLCGNWTYNWYDEVIRVKSIDRNSGQITLASPALYSVKSGRFYALNLLEKLDVPGEFYIDAKNRRLYFWPPAPIEHARIVLSTLDAPLLSIDKARNITFSGMIFENSLGDTIHCSDASGVRIERRTVRNVRQLGISINGGSNDVVDSCEIYDTGTGGLYLDGGDRRTLTPAHHLAINNRIHNFSRLQLTGAYAITLAGVGNRAAHNLIHDVPHQAILIAGNDNVVEYNIIRKSSPTPRTPARFTRGATPPAAEISSTATSSATSATPTATPAPLILTTATAGIASSATSFCAAAASVPSRDLLARWIRHPRRKQRFHRLHGALGSSPWATVRWKDALNGGQDCNWPTKMLKDVDSTSEVYTKRYPELVGFMNPQPTTPAPKLPAQQRARSLCSGCRRELEVQPCDDVVNKYRSRFRGRQPRRFPPAFGRGLIPPSPRLQADPIRANRSADSAKALSMPKPTDILIHKVCSNAERINFRVPMKFGGRVMTGFTLLNVTVEVETRDGRRGSGFGSMPMANVWAWPSHRVSGDEAERAMNDLGEHLATEANQTPTQVIRWKSRTNLPKNTNRQPTKSLVQPHWRSGCRGPGPTRGG